MSLFGRSRQPEVVEPKAPMPNGKAPQSTSPIRQSVPMPTPHEQPTYEVEGFVDSAPYYNIIKDRMQEELLKEMAPGTNWDREESLTLIDSIYNTALSENNVVISRDEKVRLRQSLIADILGLGPIQPLMDDEAVSEVMVNGPQQVYVERKGKLTLTNVKFKDNEHVLSVIERIIAPLGRRLDESSPMVDARTTDGSRVNAIIPPLAIDGPSLTIRKFSKIPLTVADLIRFGSFTEEFAMFVNASVASRLNIIVSGGTGSGKTTLLNVLSSFIPSDNRIVTIEDSAELQLRQDHVVRLETRPPNVEGRGAVTIRDLVRNSLRMRPDRLVIGEVRGGEALDMLQAMNTGHDGSLATAHSNSPRDTLSRLETMVLMAGMDLPLRAIRQQVASAVDMIVHIERLRDGSRRIVYCTEVLGMEGETILMQDIFHFVEEGMEDGKVIGRLMPSGIRPKVLDRFKDDQVQLPPDLFNLPFHSDF